MSSDISDELKNTATDDFGFKSLGSIKLVGDFEEKLPYRKINNLSYAPHRGLIAAAGPSELIINSIESLRRQVNEGKDKCIPTKSIEISGINNIIFTKDEKNLLFSKDKQLNYYQLPSDGEMSGITSSSFSVIEVPDSIEKISSSYTQPDLIAISGSSLSLNLVNLSTKDVLNITSGVFDFDWSPNGEKLIIAKDDGSLKVIKTDGSELENIPQPEDIQDDDSVVPLSVAWLLDDRYVAIYGEVLEYDESEDPFYDVKIFFIEKQDDVFLFHESYDAISASGTVWRKSAIYSASFRDLSNSLPRLNIVASSVSPEISAITSEELLSPGNDSERASLPMNEATNNDVNPVGLILDPRNDNGPLESVCDSISEAKWLPIVWVLGHDGRLEGWYIFHVHDVRDGSLKKEGVLSYEDQLYKMALGNSTASSASIPSKEVKNIDQIDNPFAKASPFDSSNPALSKPTDSKPAFGAAGFGMNASGSTAPAFGSSSFGQTSFGSSTHGKNLFDTSSSNPSFGSSGFGAFAAASKDSPFASMGSAKGSIFGGDDAKKSDSPFASMGSAKGSIFGGDDAKKSDSPFASMGSAKGSIFGGDDAKKSDSPFASMGSAKGSIFGGDDAKKSDSPFASMGSAKDSIFGGDDAKKSDSPFGSIGGGKKEDSLFGSFGSSNKTNSPFDVGKKKDSAFSPFVKTDSNKSDSPFASFDQMGQTLESPFAAFGKTDESKADSKLASFQKQEPAPFSFGTKDAFSSGVGSSLPHGTQSEDEDDDDDDEESEDTDDGEKPPQIKPSFASSSTGESAIPQSQGPTSFNSSGSAGNSSGFGQSGFGTASSGGFGKSSFGQSAFGNVSTTESESVFGSGQGFNIGSSGFGAFADKKMEFGGVNIFADGGEDAEGEKDDQVVEDEESAEGGSATAAEDEIKDQDLSDEEGDEEIEDEDADDDIEDEDVDDEKEDELEGEEDEDDDDDDDDEDDIDELDEDIEENLNVDSQEPDPAIDGSLSKELENELNIDDEADEAISLHTSEEDLYNEAKELSQEGKDKAPSTKTEQYRDSNVQTTYETNDQSQNTTPPVAESEVQTDPIEYVSIGIKSFENDQVHQGEFSLPKPLRPYISMKEVKYPPLSEDLSKKTMEKLIYDTDAELEIVCEVSKNFRDFINDQLNPEVQHGVESLSHGYQWRLSEIGNLNRILDDKKADINALCDDLKCKLTKVDQLKKDLNSMAKESKSIKEMVLSLELKDDKKMLDLRDLTFDAKLLQGKLRKLNVANNDQLRSAEEKLMVLKATVETIKETNTEENTVNPTVLEGLVNHMNIISKNYSNDTKEITNRIANLNRNHQEILNRLSSKSSHDNIIESDQFSEKAIRQLKVDDVFKRYQRLESLATSHRSKSVKELTTTI